MTAAVLAFLVGMVVVSQANYATTMERLEGFATLKDLGARSGDPGEKYERDIPEVFVDPDDNPER